MSVLAAERMAVGTERTKLSRERNMRRMLNNRMVRDDGGVSGGLAGAERIKADEGRKRRIDLFYRQIVSRRLQFIECNF